MITKTFYLPNNNWSAIKEDIEFSPDAKYLINKYAVHRVSDYAFAILSKHPAIDSIIEKHGGILATDLFRTSAQNGHYPHISGNEELINEI